MSWEKPLPSIPLIYPTQLPSHFPIGSTLATPLVDLTELKAHLRLLGAINKLKENVQSQKNGIAATNKNLGWVVFVNRAVYRFFAWTSAAWDKVPPSILTEEYIPPLDVIMVWHTYLLNPRAFYEDSRPAHLLTGITGFRDFPLKLLSSLINPRTLDPVPPTKERKAYFELNSKHTYDMLLVTDMSDVLTLACPFCTRSNEHVRWITNDDKGFAQTQFVHTCVQCRRDFTKSNIGVRRFCEEVTKRRPPSGHAKRLAVVSDDRVFISETLLRPTTGIIDETASHIATANMLKWLDVSLLILRPIPVGSTAQEEVTKLATALNYDHLQLSDALHRGFRPYVLPDRQNPVPKLQRIAVAYSHAGLASLDLVGAVLRQGSFIEKMVGLDWTRPGRFVLAGDAAPLVRSIARYHAFLDLMASNPALFLVPTLDIDLAWHTHQLKSPNYRADTLCYLERTPNHDDSIESSGITSGYDITAEAWKARFGVPYSVCGCVPDRTLSQSTLGKVLSRIGSIKSSRAVKRASRFLSPSPSPPASPPLLRPQSPIPSPHSPIPSPPPFPAAAATVVIDNIRPDLVSTEEEDADASHPSEHSMHFGGHPPGDSAVLAQVVRREQAIVKSVASARKAAEKDLWRGLQAERHERRKWKGHKEAFTDPHSPAGYGTYYAYWGVSSEIPIGFYGGFRIGDVGGCGSGCGTGGCSSGGCGIGEDYNNSSGSGANGSVSYRTLTPNTHPLKTYGL
ncbi:hypothetical protein FRC17_010054 [Serendipita sp. 399]|nr:hypothetical protein FRC17_010054 [Serendipita sp. 399]